MAAFGTTPTASDKKSVRNATQAMTIGAVYTRIINLKFTTAEAASGAGLVNAYIPAGTHVLAAYISIDATNTNATTVALSAGGKVFCAATAPVKDTWVAATVTNADANMALTGESQVTATLGAQAGGFVVCNVSVAIVCASLGAVPNVYTTFTI
jgi:hypothetical protein